MDLRLTENFDKAKSNKERARKMLKKQEAYSGLEFASDADAVSSGIAAWTRAGDAAASCW